MAPRDRHLMWELAGDVLSCRDRRKETGNNREEKQEEKNRKTGIKGTRHHQPVSSKTRPRSPDSPTPKPQLPKTFPTLPERRR